MAAIILLGPPGSGKGTQGRILADKLGVPHISSGQMLRDIAASEISPLADEVRRYIDRGLLAPDVLVNKVLRERLSFDDCRRGFILDGYPRTLAQACELDAILAETGRMIDGVIELDIDDDVSVSRNLARGRAGSGRKDDADEPTIRGRLREYHELTAPLVDHYTERGIVSHVNGELSIEEVAAQIDHALGIKARPVEMQP